MQPIGDGIACLGSRLGIIWDPANKTSYLLGFDEFPGREIDIQIGIRVGDRRVILPVSAAAPSFEFCDQRTTPTSISLIGIDPDTALKVELVITAPFRPRDLEFSSVPVLDISCTLSKLPGAFRWHTPKSEIVDGEVFIEIEGADIGGDLPNSQTLFVLSQAEISEGCFSDVIRQDLIVWHSGDVKGSQVSLPFQLASGQPGPTLHASWCMHSGPVLHIQNEPSDFYHSSRFTDVKDIASWAIRNPMSIQINSRKVDGLLLDHCGGRNLDNMLTLTLHSWLVNTWLVTHPKTKRPHFTVWEGSCYFHSTVDVEYTQAPFYLSIWPELLEIQLDQWCDYMRPGEDSLGERGEGTLFLWHDMGRKAYCGAQAYPHNMEVEETANWLIMTYAHWRRTGKDAIIRKHSDKLAKLLDFLLACDTTGNGLPDKGVANTVDDASPAVQFGRDQIYLAVKVLSSLEVGAEILEWVGKSESCRRYRAAADKTRAAINERGWADDHFVTLLDSSAEGLANPWTGQEMHGEMPGWDAAHIYTANGLALLDMVGRSVGIDEEKLSLDLVNATNRCMRYYGCTHSDYAQSAVPLSVRDGLAGAAAHPGWIAMNLIRDISAAYRGVDLLHLIQRYWEYQMTTNGQSVSLFFETFSGNNLKFYPRGLVSFGLLDAMLGLRIDRVSRMTCAKPLRQGFSGSVLLDADWVNGVAPRVSESGEIASVPDSGI